MTKKTDKLVELLPEGVDESVATEIAEVVAKIVQEQVETRAGLLEAKVVAFLRENIEQIKKAALAELAHEDGDYRDAMLFREMKSLFLFDADPEAQGVALSKVSEESSELKEELDTLTESLAEVTAEKDKYENTSKALAVQLKKAGEALVELKEKVAGFKPKPFKSSERAQMASKVHEGKEVNKDNGKVPNAKELNEELAGILSEASMALMPK